MKYLKIYENYPIPIPFMQWLNNTNIFDRTTIDCDNVLLSDIEGIEKLKDLRVLRFKYNALKSLNGFENLTSLSLLSVWHNELTNLKGIENLINLKKLYFFDNNISSLKGVENLINLERFGMAGNKLTSLKGIENLAELVYLNISENFISDLKELTNLKKLEVLHCSSNKLKNLDNMQNLNIYDVFCNGNPWECPLSKELVKKFDIIYSEENKEYFKTYESQKLFLTKYPERTHELKEFGFHEKIKEEFADLIEGSEFGFFNLQ